MRDTGYHFLSIMLTNAVGVVEAKFDYEVHECLSRKMHSCCVITRNMSSFMNLFSIFSYVNSIIILVGEIINSK